MTANRRRSRIFTFCYIAVIFLRFCFGPLIFFYPLIAIIGSLLLDMIDVEFASRKVLSLDQYELFDKMLDFWWYINVIVFSYLYLNKYFIILIFLFCFRLIGESLFIVMKNRLILFFFPNYFENVFLLIFFASYIPQLAFLIKGNAFYLSILIIFLLKIFQEAWVHLAKISIPKILFNKEREWLDD